ncbi:hypothetical protein Cni_G03544 [Canna indica]|uniref:Uncharacterized protein n=1 Tax=Canna indica TaxID=4628 RepID=A0AAQ3Q3J3_9LILI|nr:hypothetical protein Cni_G03544 [Canna indica]
MWVLCAHNGQPFDQLLSEKHAGNFVQASFSDTPPLQPPLPPNYQLSVNPNQPRILTASFGYPPPAEGPQRYYTTPYGIALPESMPVRGSIQTSILGYSTAPSGISGFAGGAPQTLETGQTFILAQGVPDGIMNLTYSKGRIQFMRGHGGQLSGEWRMNNPKFFRDQ